MSFAHVISRGGAKRVDGAPSSLSLLPSLPFIAAFFASFFRSKKLFDKENFVDLFLLIRNSNSRRFDNNFSNKEKEGKRGGLEHFCKIIGEGRENGTRSMKGRGNSFFFLFLSFRVSMARFIRHYPFLFSFGKVPN